MGSGKRRPGESFEDYRARLKEESKELKKQMRGTVVHVSSIITEKADEESKKLPRKMRDLVKVAVLGTYRKVKK